MPLPPRFASRVSSRYGFFVLSLALVICTKPTCLLAASEATAVANETAHRGDVASPASTPRGQILTYPPSYAGNSTTSKALSLTPSVPPDTQQKSIVLGEQVWVWTTWYLDTNTCKSLGTGTMTGSQGPKYGVLFFDIEDVKLPPGYPCAGVTLPANVAYYTWTEPVPNSVVDFFHIHYQCAGGSLDKDWQAELVGKGMGKPCKLDGCGHCSKPGCPGAGDPINVGTGNVFETVTDYETAGQNKLAFIRYYNSLGVPDTFSSALGVNWRSNYDRYINILTPGFVAVERPDGQVLTFQQKQGLWIPDSDVDLRLGVLGQTFTVSDQNDTMETYTVVGDTQANLTSIQTRNGYTQTLKYNAQNQLESVTDSYGRQLLFTYKGNALQTVTTPDGLILTYAYDTIVGGIDNRLNSVSYSTNPVTSQKYLYENAGVPFALTGIVDENGARYSTWTYDQFGRGISSQRGSGSDLTKISYNDTDGSRVVTNAFGVNDTYNFAILQATPKLAEIERAATSTTAAATRHFSYDDNGFLASMTDWNGNETTYVNDAHGQPTTITEPTRTTTIGYDPVFVHLPHRIITDGLTSTFAYDGSGNLLSRSDTDTTSQNIPYVTNGITEAWKFTWQNSLLASVKTPRTDVNGLTQFTYDGSGALATITNALGHQTQITSHTGGGLPLTIVDANSVTTTLTYDDRLRPHTETVHTSHGNFATTYAYDAAGNLLSVALPDGATLTNSYDAAHRLTGTTDLFGQSISYTLDALGDRTLINVKDANHSTKLTHSGKFDALGRVLQDIGGMSQTTTYSYDSDGNPLTVVDPLTYKTTRVFDALNRLVTSTDPANGLTGITYDTHDRPLTVTDPNGGQTVYTYDGFGDVIQQVSPDSATTVYYYDLDGNLIKRVTAANAVTQYTYDALDRLRSKTYPSEPSLNVYYGYDQGGQLFGKGRLTSVADALGQLSRTYDERGNVTVELRRAKTALLSTIYSYDAAGRRASITYHSGWNVSYTRDGMGRVTAISAKPRNGVAQPVVSGVGYQPFGPVSAFTYGNTVAETRTFDLDYRLGTLIDMGGKKIQSLKYAYDADDNVTTLTDNVNPGNTQNFGYDVLNRLVGASGGYGSYSWTYNPVGSRLTETLGAITTNYGYGTNNNQLLSLAQNGITIQTIGYTADGNSNSFDPGIPSPGGPLITGLKYNQEGQLASVLANSQTLSSYFYDGFGQRLEKDHGSGFYLYDIAGHLLEETYPRGAAQVDYVYLGDVPVATIAPSTGKVYFLHNDRLGTPQLATDSTQQTAWSATYLPFGGTSSVQGLITQNLRLAGAAF